MCPGRTLKRNNVEKVTADSVSHDEITTQQKELAAAERRMQQAGNRVLKTRNRLESARQRLADARGRYHAHRTAPALRALDTAQKGLQQLRQDLERLLSEHRELKLIVRDQRNLVNSLEKKEVARQKAVARFLKEWERDYDRKMRMKQKTLEKRKRLV